MNKDKPSHANIGEETLAKDQYHSSDPNTDAEQSSRPPTKNYEPINLNEEGEKSEEGDSPHFTERQSFQAVDPSPIQTQTCHALDPSLGF